MHYPQAVIQPPPGQNGGGNIDTLEKFGEVLAVLHRDGPRQPVDKFHEWAFDALKTAVDFDAGFWGVGTWAANGEPVMRNVYLHNMPAAAMGHDWNAMKMDPAHQAILKQLSTTGDSVAFGTDVLGADPFCVKYGLRAVVTNCVLEPTSRLLHIFSFYRREDARPFDEDARRLHQALAPHAFDIEREVWLRQFSATPLPSSDASAQGNQALCDGEGTLRLTQKGFVGAVLEEWPSWQGPVVPEALLETIRKGQGCEIAGERTVVAIVRRHDMFIMTARKRGPVDDLSPRERLVALKWGRGGTAKEIAAQMGISPATVRNHIANIYEKLAVSGRPQLAAALGER